MSHRRRIDFVNQKGPIGSIPKFHPPGTPQFTNIKGDKNYKVPYDYIPPKFRNIRSPPPQLKRRAQGTQSQRKVQFANPYEMVDKSIQTSPTQYSRGTNTSPYSSRRPLPHQFYSASLDDDYNDTEDDVNEYSLSAIEPSFRSSSNRGSSNRRPPPPPTPRRDSRRSISSYSPSISQIESSSSSSSGPHGYLARFNKRNKIGKK